MITLSTLKDATEQEIFDQVSTHLLTQGKKSVKSGSCAYRGSGGLKCAAGCLISDDEYDESFEGTIFGYVEMESLVKGVSGKSLDLIQQLQSTHDSYNAKTWKDRLIDIAEEHNLKFNFKETAQ